ncbi:ATP-binding protein [Deinococcus sonorensis]|uniref:ATP-binding protein n=1 Tax=Deinococcus sonorensis TaxID=309891 RepID=A0ABV8YA18_9DEIO
MGALRITLLGPPQLWLDDQPLALTSRKLTVLLAYLLLEPGRHTREDLAGLFWPDSEPEVARSALRTLLSQLRRLLPDRLHVEGPLVDLRLHPQDTVDVLCDGPAPSDLPFLQGLEVEEGELRDWLSAMRTHLQVQQRTRLQQAARHLEEQGQLAEARQFTERWFELDRTDEDATQMLMTLAHRFGSASQVQATYERHRHALAQEVDAQPSDRVQTLLTQLRTPLPYRAAEPKGSGLPERRLYFRFPTMPGRIRSFVGRQTELAQLHRLLEHGARLLTLLGMGGIGKTRLALELAFGLSEHYRDRVAFVPLESLQDPGDLPRVILTALGQEVSRTGDLLQQLIHLLDVRPSVVVLDNFEHLMDGAEIVECLLTACPELRLIVTSREALNLQQEHLFPVLGLQQRPPDQQSEQAGPSEAVQLWLQRARQVRSDFQLTDATRPYVEQLCQRVGGAPLGIELAASWLKVLTIEELAHDLSLDLDLAASIARNVPARHQSLRAVFEYSWNRLSPQEQRALAGLSVFRGGFTREAAREVVGVSIQLLSRLVDTSLLLVDPSGRFDRHPLVYQYTQEKLEASTEAEDFRTRHIHYFQQLAAAAYPYLSSPFEDRWLDQLDLEYQNFILALEQLKRTGERQTLLGLCADLALFWSKRSHTVFGRQWLRDALHAGGDASETLEYARVQCLLCVSAVDAWIATAEEWAGLREGIRGCRRHGDQRTLAAALRTLAFYPSTPAEEAQRLVQEARRLYEQLNEPSGIIATINMQGILAIRAHQSLSAQRYFEQSVSMANRLADPFATSAHVYLGILKMHQREYQQAIPMLNEGMMAARRKRNWVLVGRIISYLSAAHVGLGQLEEATRLSHEGLRLFRSVGHRWDAANMLLDLAANAIGEGELDEAERLIQAARQEAGTEWNLPEVTAAFEGQILQRQHHLSQARHQYLQVLSRPYTYTAHTALAIQIALEAYLTLPLETVAAEELVQLLSSLPTLRAEVLVLVIFTPGYRAELDAGHACTAQRAREVLGDDRFESLMQSSRKLPLAEVQELIQHHAMAQLMVVKSD